MIFFLIPRSSTRTVTDAHSLNPYYPIQVLISLILVPLGAKLVEFLGAELGTSLGALNLVSLGTNNNVLMNPELVTSLV